MATAIAKGTERTIARPLKVLIPMIQSELQQGNNAGHEHYMRAGQMLIEAKDQVGYGGWRRWLAKNFELSHQTASLYMKWARDHDDLASDGRQVYQSMRDMRGATERDREQRESPQNKRFKAAMRDIMKDRDEFVQQRQRHAEEIEAYREMATKYGIAGLRAMAMIHHPDRGGSKNAMAMLNRIHEDFMQYVKTRRYV